MSTTRQFWCFISYRHADNKEAGRQWATWLHQQLETYEVPEDLVGALNEAGEKIPDRIFPVFRDEEELPVDADLSSPIFRALDNSRYMVVLCSPQAVESRYVADEIRYFKKTGKADHLLAVMIEGEPNASLDPAKKDLKECFPKPLQHPVDKKGNLIEDQFAEPIAADFRLPDGGMGWTSPEAYRQALKESGAGSKSDIEQEVKRYQEQSTQALLKIIAGTLGVPLGTLTKRDKAYQLEKERRRLRIFRRVAAVMGVLLVISVITGIIAFQQRQVAVVQRNLAEHNEKLANQQRDEAERQRRAAQQHLAKAYLDRGNDCFINGSDYDGLLWIAKAFETDENLTRDRSLWMKVKSSLGKGIPPEKLIPLGKEELFSRISLDGRYILMVAKDWQYFVFNLETDSFVVKPQRFAEKPAGASFSGDGQSFVIFSEHQFQAWDLTNGNAWHDPVPLASIHPWMETRIPSDPVHLPEITGIRLDTATRDVLLALRGYETYSPHGKGKGEIIPTHLLSYDSKYKTVQIIWELEHETLDPTEYPHFYNHGGGQYCIVFDGDGAETVLHFYLDEKNQVKQMQTRLDNDRGNMRQWDMGPSYGSVLTFPIWDDGLPDGDFDWGYYYPHDGSEPVALDSRLIEQISPEPKDLNVKDVAMNSDFMTLMYSVENDSRDSDGLEYHLVMLAADQKEISVLNHQTIPFDSDDDKVVALHPEGEQLAVYDKRTCEVTTFSLSVSKGLVEIGRRRFPFLADLKHYLHYLKYLPGEGGLLVYDYERLYHWRNGDLFGPYKCIPKIDPDKVAGFPSKERIGVISDDAGVLNLFTLDHTTPFLGSSYKKPDHTIVKDLRVDNKGKVTYLALQEEGMDGSKSKWQIFTGTGQDSVSALVHTPSNLRIREDDGVTFVNDTWLKIKPEYGDDTLIINMPGPMDTGVAPGKRRADMPFKWISESGAIAVRVKDTFSPAYGSNEQATATLQTVVNRGDQSHVWQKTFPAFSKLIMDHTSQFFVLLGSDSSGFSSSEKVPLILASLQTGDIISQTQLVLPEGTDMAGFTSGEAFLLSDRLLALHCSYPQNSYFFFDSRTGKECAVPVKEVGDFGFILIRSPDEVYISINDEDRSRFEVVKVAWTDGKWQSNAYPITQPWTKAFIHPNQSVALVDQGDPFSDEEMVRLWDLAAMAPISKKFLTKLKETDEFDVLHNVNDAVWTSDNRFVVAHTDNAVYLFNAETGGLIKRLQQYAEQDNESQEDIHITCMALSPNNEWVVTGSDNGAIQRNFIDAAPIPLHRFKRQSAVFSGKYINDLGELLPINWTTYAEKYNAYSSK